MNKSSQKLKLPTFRKPPSKKMKRTRDDQYDHDEEGILPTDADAADFVCAHCNQASAATCISSDAPLRIPTPPHRYPLLLPLMDSSLCQSCQDEMISNVRSRCWSAVLHVEASVTLGCYSNDAKRDRVKMLGVVKTVNKYLDAAGHDDTVACVPSLQAFVTGLLKKLRRKSSNALAGETMVHSIEYYALKSRLTGLVDQEYARAAHASEEEWLVWMHQVAGETTHWPALSDAMEDLKAFLSRSVHTHRYVADKVRESGGVAAYVQSVILEREFPGSACPSDRAAIVTQQLTSCASYGGLRAAFVLALSGQSVAFTEWMRTHQTRSSWACVV